MIVVLPRVVHSHHAWSVHPGLGNRRLLGNGDQPGVQLRRRARASITLAQWVRRLPMRRSSTCPSREHRQPDLDAERDLGAGRDGRSERDGRRARRADPAGCAPRVFIQGLAPIALGRRNAAVCPAPARALVTLIRLWALVNTAMCALIGVGARARCRTTYGPRASAGASWHYAKPLLVFVVLITIGNAVLVPAQTGLKCLGVTRISATVRTMTAPLPAVFTVIGGVLVEGSGTGGGDRHGDRVADLRADRAGCLREGDPVPAQPRRQVAGRPGSGRRPRPQPGPRTRTASRSHRAPATVWRRSTGRSEATRCAGRSSCPASTLRTAAAARRGELVEHLPIGRCVQVPSASSSDGRCRCWSPEHARPASGRRRPPCAAVDRAGCSVRC